ncbi:hypothetical protein V2J09_010319 [Rumex salicifolius]
MQSRRRWRLSEPELLD